MLIHPNYFNYEQHINKENKILFIIPGISCSIIHVAQFKTKMVLCEKERRIWVDSISTWHIQQWYHHPLHTQTYSYTRSQSYLPNTDKTSEATYITKKKQSTTAQCVSFFVSVRKESLKKVCKSSSIFSAHNESCVYAMQYLISKTTRFLQILAQKNVGMKLPPNISWPHFQIQNQQMSHAIRHCIFVRLKIFSKGTAVNHIR